MSLTNVIAVLRWTYEPDLVPVNQIKPIPSEGPCKWVSSGEDPQFYVPSGFDWDNALGLPYGYEDVIRLLKRMFDIK